MNSKDIAIKIQNMSKCYRIGVKEKIHDTFGGTIIDFIKSPLKNYRKYRSLYKFDEINPNLDTNSDFLDIIWALKDVSFEVKQGEVLGIIGLNGAGKSTLLKILSQITDPTSGFAKIRGRVTSLLEVGTGFNPELTGRENVYLNGTILGMKKKEIDQKFDEIVDFSEVEKFIDTPVKRYSSGMKVRLAFSVAAHLEPEVLIIDEVLAVGDIAFQKKCLGKMGDVARGGRTILFVSHNMAAINELCDRTLWLEGGRLKLDGPTMDVVSEYMAPLAQGTGYWTRGEPTEPSDRKAWLRHARIFSGNGDNESNLFHYEEQIMIEIGYEIKSRVRLFRSYFLLRDSRGNILWASHDTDGSDVLGQFREPGIYHSTCALPVRLLRPGKYYMTFGIFGKPRKSFEEEQQDGINFEISESGYPFKSAPRQGSITPYHTWKIVRQ